ncbi:hypothetical protein Q4491_20300 [Photobacterium sp. 2_MG-2023]|uniref:hypothetical protein n=1 Tax=Photobacterium sp. 2_MG-2023 TaxID=3062663 RepID=UPI0026E46C50|nr:hypothetical protein [Photobacterium sp. 2_MG-2023]MDO6583688.1 hypothetical protein [Photobacterium sp. 2_MG-2023]
MNTAVSLPECTEEYKQQQRQKVLDSEVVHEWECILRSTLKPYTPIIMSGILSVMFGVFYFLSGDFHLIYFWAFLMLVMVPVSYFLFDVDYNYKGQITPKGIIVQKTERVPEIFYKATRGMAYIGIVVCVIAALMVGPLAFVGAGAFALLSFKMTGFQKQPEVYVRSFLKGIPCRIRRSEMPYQYEVQQFSSHCKSLKDLNDNAEQLRCFHRWTINCTAEQEKEVLSQLSRFVEFENKV